MARRRRHEIIFEESAREAGFEVQPPRSIRAPQPVSDKRGEKKKTVTVPDCYVYDPDSELGMYVELTRSGGDTPHKASQRAVAESAGVENYIQVTGHEISTLHRTPSKDAKRLFLLTLFGWLTP